MINVYDAKNLRRTSLLLPHKLGNIDIPLASIVSTVFQTPSQNSPFCAPVLSHRVGVALLLCVVFNQSLSIQDLTTRHQIRHSFEAWAGPITVCQWLSVRTKGHQGGFSPKFFQIKRTSRTARSLMKFCTNIVLTWQPRELYWISRP